MICRKLYRRWMADVQREKIRQILGRVKFLGPVLDVGAGPGFLEEKIKAIAADVNPADLRKFSGPRALADGDRLPFADGTFATVFCIDTVHLLKNPAELVRVLAGNGQLVASLPCNRWNSEERFQELRKKFSKLKMIDRFLVKTEPEWDAVAVFKVRAARRPRTAR